VLLFPYYFVLMCWPQQVLTTIYGGNSPYLGLKLALQLSVLTYLFGYLAGMGMTTLNGMERGAQAFLAQLASVATVLALGLPLTAQVGLIGAVVGSACATLARLLVSGVFLRRYVF
jgi:O-antigen/teichoic acid export membrane protein